MGFESQKSFVELFFGPDCNGDFSVFWGTPEYNGDLALWRILVHLGAILAHLGAILAQLGAILAQLGAISLQICCLALREPRPKQRTIASDSL